MLIIAELGSTPTLFLIWQIIAQRPKKIIDLKCSWKLQTFVLVLVSTWPAYAGFVKNMLGEITKTRENDRNGN